MSDNKSNMQIAVQYQLPDKKTLQDFLLRETQTK